MVPSCLILLYSRLMRPMLTKNLTLILLLSSIFSLNISVASPQHNQKNVHVLTRLDQLIKLAIDNNAELKSKKLAWQSMIEQYPQATALSDPKLVYTEAIDPIETRLGPQDRVVSLSQKLPFPGKLTLQGKVVKKDINISKIRYEMASRNLVVALKQAFYELVYLETAVSLTWQNQKTVEKISHIATTDYAASNSTLNDVAKAQSQYAQVSYDVQLLQELVSTEKTRINTLLNRNPEQAFKVKPYSNKTPVKLAHSLQQLYEFSASNEELKIADISIEKGAIKQDIASYTSLPDFNVGVRYTQIGESIVADLDRSGDDGLALSVGINIPINYYKNKAVKHQAYLQKQKSIEDKKALLNSMNNSVKALFFKINNSYRQATLYHKNLLPQAQRAKQIAEIQYRENKGSIAQYLETQSTWLNFQLAYQRAVADYWKNRAAMEKLTGRSL